jgi:hypothetical protein
MKIGWTKMSKHAGLAQWACDLCKWKLDEQKMSKHAGLAQWAKNGFGAWHFSKPKKHLVSDWVDSFDWLIQVGCYY